MFCGAFIAILETIAANKCLVCFELKPLSLEEVRSRDKFFSRFCRYLAEEISSSFLLVSDDLTHITF